MKKYLSNVTLHRNCLIGYWIVLILVVLVYLYSLVIMTGQDLQIMLKGNAAAAVALFIVMLTGMNLLIFYRLEGSALNDDSKTVVLYGLLLQQLCTQNLLGGFFLFLYWKSAGYKKTVKWRGIVAFAWLITVVLVLGAVISLFLLYRLSGLMD